MSDVDQPEAQASDALGAAPGLKRLTWIAILVSAGWALLIVAIVFAKRESAADMSMNAWGDFLAGVTAPLALFWLIVGYFQQGKELALNTKALEAQVRETATLAENSARQAEAAELHAKLMATDQQQQLYNEQREARPVVQSIKSVTTGTRHEVTLANRGGEIRDLRIVHEGGWKLRLSTFSFLGSGNTMLTLTQTEPPTWPVRFRLHFTNRLDQQQTLAFELSQKLRLREVAHNPEATQP